MSARHPEESVLALLAGGDLPWWKRAWLSRHAGGCADCGRKLRAFQRDRKALQALSAELPEGLDWDGLATEMTANIRVGLEAGECVNKPVARPVSLGWKPAVAFATVAVLLAGGWWLNMPPTVNERIGFILRSALERKAGERPLVNDAGILVAAGQDGLEVKQNGASMTLMSPGSSCPSVVTASTRGEVRARYVDQDTGQVTITNVYAQ